MRAVAARIHGTGNLGDEDRATALHLARNLDLHSVRQDKDVVGVTHLALSILFVAFLCFVAFKFGEANERIKHVTRRRTGVVDLTQRRRR